MCDIIFSDRETILEHKEALTTAVLKVTTDERHYFRRFVGAEWGWQAFTIISWIISWISSSLWGSKILKWKDSIGVDK